MYCRDSTFLQNVGKLLPDYKGITSQNTFIFKTVKVYSAYLTGMFHRRNFKLCGNSMLFIMLIRKENVVNVRRGSDFL
jgi:hypothetical protein